MSELSVVIVTGANRGIGLAIAEKIASTYGSIHLYAASRAGADLGLKAKNSSSQISYPKLDIGDADSIQAFLHQVREAEGKVDVLINNAGVNLDDQYTPVNAAKTLDVNYLGTLRMCQAFMPLMAKTGRIVNLSSVGSSLGPYDEKVQERFRDPGMTLPGLEDLAQEYLQAAESGKEAEKGFGGPGKAYSFSKACVNGFTATLARENPDLTINCCCPGWVNTDMGNQVGKPPKAPADGAKIPFKLAFGDIGKTSGRYWANSDMSSTEDGQVQSW